MALITQDYYCEKIKMASELRIVLPDACLNEKRRPSRTLFLLSAGGESGSAWLSTTKLAVLCDLYDCSAVLVPSLEGCYVNMAYGYPFYDSLKYSLEYLRTYLPGVLCDTGDMAAAGTSAGGFAALRWALEGEDTFRCAGSIAGILTAELPAGGWFTPKRIECLYGTAEQAEAETEEFLSSCRDCGKGRWFIFSSEEDPGHASSVAAAEALGTKAVLHTAPGFSDGKKISDSLGEFFRYWKGGEG